MPSPIFFIHPPKSGGSTVISFFDLNKGKDQFVNFEWEREGWENSHAKLMTTRIGGGHQPYGMHRSLKSALTYCTILRDPLARQISHYWFAANGKNGAVVRGASVSPTEALVRRGAISLDEWVSESLAGKNLFTQMLSGHSVVDESSLEVARAHVLQHFAATGVCEDMSEFLLRLCGKTGLKLPFFFETNKTSGTPTNRTHVSETARQTFVSENRFDYEIFRDVNQAIAQHALQAGDVFSKALESVRTIQQAINQLENPYEHSSVVFGFDEKFLSQVLSVINQFDVTPIKEYIEFAQSQPHTTADMYDGFVDTVHNGVISGWAVNLTRPGERVPLEVRVGTEVVARGSSGEYRPDVAGAGYPSSHTGFSIPLPAGVSEGFHVTIENSLERLHNAGVWQQGWHCAA